MGPKKRLSLMEKIDHIVEAGDEMVFLTLEELGKESDEYRGLRFHGKKTQLDQDRILKLYRQFVKAFFYRDLLGQDPTNESLDLSCFPSDHAVFLQRARRFLIFMIANGNPRSIEDEHITYRTACQYRRHLLFWMNRKYMERNVEGARPAKVFNELTEAMRGAAMLRQVGKATTSKAYIGLAEIQYMIDLDMRSTPAIEVAEQHHLAWCLGRTTALRPSSFGPQVEARREKPVSTGYDDFVMWKDMKITRGSEQGAFNVRLTIRNLKTNRIDPEASTEGPNQIAFNILSPQNKANVLFSVPHRLLVMALRRQAIQGIDTLGELLSGQLASITIKPEFLDRPVFLAASSRGLNIDDNKPMPANALTNYIQIRGQAAGFPDKITFYSIRRRMATDLVNSFDNDAAREIMGHSPTSRVLETSYLEFNNIRHTTAVGLGEHIEGQESDRRAALHQQLLRRLEENLIKESRGQALNALVQETLHGDEDFERLEKNDEIKNYVKRTRRRCFVTLWKQLRAEAERTLTKESLEQRKQEIFKDASAFAEQVLNEVRKGKTVNEESELSPDIAGQAEGQGINFDVDFPETPFPTQPEDDAEGRKLAHDTELIARMDEGSQDDEEHIDRAISYLDVARTFMEILYTNSLSTYKPDEKVKCPLCAADPTMPADDKNKERLLVHHRVHLKANVHSGFEQFRRVAHLALQEKQRTDSENPQRCECPFCTQIFPMNCNEALQSFHRFDYLARHIEDSDCELIHGTGAWKLDEALIAEHDELKREAGWYDEDFRGDQKAKAQQRSAQRKTDAKAAGLERSTNVALVKGTALEGFPGFVRGGPGLSTDEIIAASGQALYAGGIDDSSTMTESIASTDSLLQTSNPTMSTDDIIGTGGGLIDKK